MPEPAAPAPETFSSEQSGIRAAADELRKRRQQAEPIIERNYVHTGGDDVGKPRPANETISLKRATTDLSQIRRDEQEVTDFLAGEEFKLQVDADRLVNA